MWLVGFIGFRVTPPRLGYVTVFYAECEGLGVIGFRESRL